MYPNQSYWERESFFKNVDIAIIGSGIVGLNAAITCKEKQPKLRVVIIEKGVLPSGASTRNAGFACFGSLTELLDDLETKSEDEVFSLVERRWRGLQKLRNRVGDTQLNYKEWGGYEIFRSDEEAIAQTCIEKIDFFNQRIQSITGLKETYQIQSNNINNFGFQGVNQMIANTAEGQIHTGNMMRALLEIAKEKGVEIYNGLSIQNIETQSDGVQLETNESWILTCQKVLIATNGFAKRLLPELAIEPARNQVLITQPIPHLKIKGCFHYDKGYFYFRNIDNRILLGGGRHLAKEAEATDEFGLTSFIKEALNKLLKTVILPEQEVAIDSYWSGILGVGTAKQPIIQALNDRVVVAVRMGGMGVAIGSLVGEEGAGLLIPN